MADVKWIKIVTDIFDDEKTLLIESMPSADSIIVIWFKLLCFAGKQNNSGVIMLNDRVAYTDEMLATVFRRDVNTVRMALNVFEKFDMIRIVDGVITIPNWGKHQNLDQLERKKEYQRNYMRDYREKQRLLTAGENEANCKTNSKANVSPLDKEEDKDTDKEKEERIYTPVITYLNEKAGTKYKPSSAKSREKIDARLNDGFTLEDFKTVIDKKCADWLHDAKMCKFLRPETLFGPKFEGYLNEINGNGADARGKHQDNIRTMAEKVGTYI